VAETLARQIAREKMAWSNPFVPLIRAGVANLKGDQTRAAALLTAAAEGFQQADMGLHAAVSQWYLGRMTGGDQGRRISSEAEAWMRHQQIRNPALMSQMLAAGFKEA
jgi:hypothetical protein